MLGFLVWAVCIQIKLGWLALVVFKYLSDPPCLQLWLYLHYVCKVWGEEILGMRLDPYYSRSHVWSNLLHTTKLLCIYANVAYLKSNIADRHCMHGCLLSAQHCLVTPIYSPPPFHTHTLLQSLLSYPRDTLTRHSKVPGVFKINMPIKLLEGGWLLL